MYATAYATPEYDVSPAFARRFWWMLTAAAVVLAGFTAVTSPSGNWTTFVFGEEYHQYSDPGGWYLGSALAMTEPGVPAAPFLGHPGQTLTLTLHGVARVLHGVHKALGGGEDFISYASGHLPTIIRASLLVMSLFSVGASYCVYRLSLQLGLARGTSLVAALAFATSWQALFYLARISVEPFATIFALLAPICSFRCTDALRSSRYRAGIAWSAGAGTALMLLVYTKLHFAIPIAGVVGLWVLVLPGRGLWRSVPARARLSIWLCFGLSAGAVFAAGLRFTDWHFFFDQWRHNIPGADTNAPAHESVVGNARESFERIASSFEEVGNFFAAFVRKGQLRQSTLVEAAFYLLAACGFVIAWTSKRVPREHIVFVVLALLALAPIVLFRRGFHYWTLLIAFAAPFFGLTVSAIAARLTPRSDGFESRALVGFAVTAIVHAGAIACYADAKRDDAAKFDHARAWFKVLQAIGPGEKIGLLNNMNDANRFYHVGLYFPCPHRYFMTQRSAVGTAFMDRLVALPSIPSREQLRGARIRFLLDSRPAPDRAQAWYIRWQDLIE